MKPGAATRPFPSTVVVALPFHSPTARMRSPLLATSPTIPCRPLPSTIVAPRITRSASPSGVTPRKRRSVTRSRMTMLTLLEELCGVRVEERDVDRGLSQLEDRGVDDEERGVGAEAGAFRPDIGDACGPLDHGDVDGHSRRRLRDA